MGQKSSAPGQTGEGAGDYTTSMAHIETGRSARFFAGLARGLLRWRWPVLLASVGLTALFVVAMGALRMDNSNEAFFMERDPVRLVQDKFSQLFSNDDFVYILIETDDFFQPDMVRRVRALARDLELRVPHLRDMTFLGNAEYVRGLADEIEITDLIEAGPHTTDSMRLARQRAMNEPLFLDNLISRDGRTTAILLEFVRYPQDTSDPRKDIAPAIYEVLAKPEHADLHVYTVGGPVVDYEFDALATYESQRLVSLALVLACLILLGVTRSFRAALAPLLIVVLGVVWTLGIVGLLGWSLTLMVIILPVLLICAGIGDAVHIVAEIQDQQRAGVQGHDSLVRGLAAVGWPCVLTTLTTAAGFLSFLATDIKPIREMGVYLALGVMAALLLSFALVPTLLSFGRRQGGLPAAESEKNALQTLLAGAAAPTRCSPRGVLAVFVVLAGLALFGYSRVEVESNFVQDLSTDLAVRRAHDYVDTRMGGSMSLEIMLDSGRPDGVKDLAFLRQLERLQDFVDGHALTEKTYSVLDLLKKMRRALYADRPDAYTLPDTSAQASEYLYLYETSGGRELDKVVSLHYDVARLSVRTRSLNTKAVRTFMADVDQFATQQLDPAIRVEYAGVMSWFRAMADHIGHGQLRSLLLALVAITIILCWSLRSVTLGLISTLPNVFPVLLTMGLMGYAGVFMNLNLVIMAPVVLAISTDDTIHFMVHFRRAFDRRGNYGQALEDTLRGVGRPLLYTTLILASGFGLFCLSNNLSIQQFGALGAFTFVWALLADFFLVPAVLLLLKPLGAERADAAGRVPAQLSAP